MHIVKKTDIATVTLIGSKRCWRNGLEWFVARIILIL